MKKIISLILFVALNFVHSLPLESEVEDEIIDLSIVGNAINGAPNELVGEMVNEWKPDSGLNPEELGSYFEGDILIPTEGRNGLVKKSSFWPGGIVPYVFDISVPETDRNTVKRCMNEYHTKTCIRFIERTTERDYLLIKNSQTGCWSSVGRIGGRQEVNLQSGGCTSTIGTPCHELMHAVGFFHEHMRSDRDSFVRILRQNIKPDAMENFLKSSWITTTNSKVPYNVQSVMHYSSTAFSKNGKNTIENKRGSNDNMGQRNGFASSDLLKINRRYKCTSFANEEPSNEVETTTQFNFGEMVSGFFSGVEEFFSGLGQKNKE